MTITTPRERKRKNKFIISEILPDDNSSPTTDEFEKIGNVQNESIAFKGEERRVILFVKKTRERGKHTPKTKKKDNQTTNSLVMIESSRVG